MFCLVNTTVFQIPALVILLVLPGMKLAAQVSPITLTEGFKEEIRREYGRRASQRIYDWESLMLLGQSRDIRHTLRLVNDFFNDVDYAEDRRTWRQEDYWATPVETLGRNAADCEDYTIGKYFTLRALGIPDSAMRMIYVSKAGLEIPHMVLTYFDDTLEEPLVLDNLVTKIEPVSQRTDLSAVYSFNSENLWLAHDQALLDGRRLGSPDSLEQWSAMLSRLP